MFDDLFSFISVKEVLDSFPPSKSAVGLDGVSVILLRRLPARCLAKLYTLWSKLYWAPKYFLDSCTIFIPKASEVDSPANLRPIYISSVLLRQYHRILNKRLIQVVPFYFQQFGFELMDGIGRAIDELETVPNNFKNLYNPCSAAFIDLRKAFDSINFESVYATLQRLGVPLLFINYIQFIYSNARNFLSFDGQISCSVSPGRGVRQGDPLSWTLFLIVLDFILRALPDRLGAILGESVRISHVAYADDILILTRNANCLQELLKGSQNS